MMERVWVDRIEGDVAVLVAGGQGRESLTLPARLLPPGVGEGAALDLHLVPAPDDETRGRVQGLLDDLFAE
jgi:hypothetical protein